jgi:predicted nuclease with TOPRIM domain
MYGIQREEYDERYRRKRRLEEALNHISNTDGTIKRHLVVQTFMDMEDNFNKRYDDLQREKDSNEELNRREIDALKRELDSVYDKIVELKVENATLQRQKGSDGNSQLDQ